MSDRAVAHSMSDTAVAAFSRKRERRLIDSGSYRTPGSGRASRGGRSRRRGTAPSFYGVPAESGRDTTGQAGSGTRVPGANTATMLTVRRAGRATGHGSPNA